MAYTNVTAFLTNAASVSITYTGTGDLPDVQLFVQNTIKYGGFWGNTSGIYQFFPATAISSIVVQ
jgi:hypothetical protein